MWILFCRDLTLQQQSLNVCSDEECVEFLFSRVLIPRMDSKLMWCTAYDIKNTCLSKYNIF